MRRAITPAEEKHISAKAIQLYHCDLQEEFRATTAHSSNQGISVRGHLWNRLVERERVTTVLESEIKMVGCHCCYWSVSTQYEHRG